MIVQPLVSTMFQESFDLVERLNVNGSCVIVNQTDLSKYPNLNKSTSDLIFVSTPSRGLSRSRNIALRASTADICVLADDDIKYFDQFRSKILEAYKKLPDADVIIFDAISLHNYRDFRYVGGKIKQLGFREILKISSVRVSFKRSSILKNNIFFNEYFGSGSDMFTSGEENIFLAECLKEGLKIYYYPETILEKTFTNSRWFKGFNDSYFVSKGALSYALFGPYYWIYILYFVFSKYPLYRKEISVKRALMKMIKGKKILNELGIVNGGNEHR